MTTPPIGRNPAAPNKDLIALKKQKDEEARVAERESLAEATGLGPARDGLRGDWLSAVAPVLAAAKLEMPSDTPFISTGTQGRHSEHLGFILAEMQSLQRQYPGGRW